MIVYCDSAALIYVLEHTGILQTKAANRLAALHAVGDEIAVSDLVRLECRVKPLRLGNAAALTAFDQFFVGGNAKFAPMSSVVFDRATTIRAQFGFGLGDSLHLAAAIQFGCGLFLTNDSRLARFPDIPISTL